MMRDIPCMLVDGSSFFYRAFHALPPLINSKGIPTGAVYGVANMVKKLISQYQPQYFAVIFDAPGKTFRNDIFPEYKAHRPPTPADLKAQYQPLVHLLKAMGVKVYAIPGVEADDVIGTLARQAEAKSIPVCIATGDKDFAQIVDSHVTLYNSMSEQWLDEATIEIKYGIKPSQFIDYLTLTGDSVDNIPGVPKCGPKTACKWLQTYQTLDNLVANAQDIKGKVGEYLRESIAQFTITKTLVTIKCDVALDFGLEDLSPLPLNVQELQKQLEELEFKTWLKSFNQATVHQDVVTPKQNVLEPKVRIIQDIEAFKQLLSAIKTQDVLYIDTETDSLDTLVAQLVGISMAINDGEIVYLPLAHQMGQNLVITEVLSLLKPLLLRDDIKLIGQNLKYDINVLKNVAIDVAKINADTMLESYVYNSSISRHDLASLAKHYLHRDSQSYEDLTGKGAKQIPFAAVSIEQAAQYSGEDIELTRSLHHFFQNHLTDSEKNLLQQIELPLVTILAKMERTGVMIDAALLSNQSIRLKQRLQDLEENAYALAGEIFNLQSPKQLANIFYDKMHLPILAKTPSGQASTAEEVLQNLAQDYELPAIILEHRRLSKLVSTYLDALPKKVHPLSGRVHTSYNQAVTATGRLSSSDPNLQNIPIRTQEGRMIRQAFIASPNHLLFTADYSQVELRIMAHLSQDSRLIAAFHHGLDIHQATAAEIFGVDTSMVTPEMRRQAKAINFGLIYGMSAFGLAKQLGIGRAEAQGYIERYFARYTGVLNYMEETKRFAKQHAFVETLLGRRLYLNDIQSKNIPRQKAAERTAINAPMQGTAADLIKKAMIDIDNYLGQNSHLRCKMIMQVHDELVFEVHQDDIAQVTPAIRQLMEHTLSLDVPLIVNLGQGQNWDEAH